MAALKNKAAILILLYSERLIPDGLELGRNMNSNGRGSHHITSG